MDGVEGAPGVTVTCVPVRHFSGRGLTDRNGTPWGGFVVAGPSGRVYFAGDTGYGPHFAETRRLLGPPLPDRRRVRYPRALAIHPTPGDRA